MDPSQRVSAGEAKAPASDGEQPGVVVGKIASPFGVTGWTKVVSFTEPDTGILDYTGWTLRKGGRTESVEVEQGRKHGKFVVVKFKDIDDRDLVALRTNAEVEVDREQFPEAEEGSFYWVDLIGLSVVNTEGVELGAVDSMLATGANDVLVVKGDRERLVPWIRPDVVKAVDLENSRLTVDWDPDF